MVGVVLAVVAVGGSAQQAKRRTAVLPLTLRSPEARRLAQQAMTLDLDQVEQAKAIEILRQAVKIDPDFAMVHEFFDTDQSRSGRTGK
jgi:hypothetical protein